MTSYFMDLPAEIRLEILRNLLPDHAVIQNDSFKDPGACEIQPVREFLPVSSGHSIPNLSVMRVNRTVYAEGLEVIASASKTTSLILKIGPTGTGFINDWRPGLINADYFLFLVDCMGDSRGLHISIPCCKIPTQSAMHDKMQCVRAIGTMRSVNHLVRAIQERQKVKPLKRLTIELDIESTQPDSNSTSSPPWSTEYRIDNWILPFLRPFGVLRGLEAVVICFTGLAMHMDGYKQRWTRLRLSRFDQIQRWYKMVDLSDTKLKDFGLELDNITKSMTYQVEVQDDTEVQRETRLCNCHCDVQTPLRFNFGASRARDLTSDNNFDPKSYRNA